MGRVGDVVSIAELVDERRDLVGVAYGMLGSCCEAEGVVDEAYRRWYGLSDRARARIVVPRSWLAGVVGGMCLDRLALPGRGHQGLTPAARAALAVNEVLRVVWGGVTAGVVDQPGLGLGREESVDGARRSVRAGHSRVTTAREHDVVAGAVRQACVTQDAVFLASLLAPDATAFFDGGGKVRALAEPVHGNEQVTRALLALLARGPRTFLDTRSVNGRTGLVVRYDRTVAAVISLDTAGHHVVQVWATLNPDKLRPWNRPGAAPGPPRPKTT